MPHYHCLSAAGPCKEVCEFCIKEIDHLANREIEIKTRDAIRWLEYQGYKVTKEIK